MRDPKLSDRNLAGAGALVIAGVVIVLLALFLDNGGAAFSALAALILGYLAGCESDEGD